MKSIILGDVCEKIGSGATPRGGNEVYLAGFCKSATLKEIQEQSYVLTPGRYVGAAELEEDDEPFEQKMARLTKELEAQFGESDKLENIIRQNLRRIETK